MNQIFDLKRDHHTNDSFFVEEYIIGDSNTADLSFSSCQSWSRPSLNARIFFSLLLTL